MVEISKEVFDKESWKDISHEIYRTYVFWDGFFEKKEITIDKPILLRVSESGGHRVLDANNVSHYIPPKWIHLYWETDDDNAFRF